MKSFFLITQFALCLSMSAVGAAAAAEPASGSCFYWARIAEEHYKMPPGLMTAIVQHESYGRPNTLNVDGKAYHFPTATEAARAIQRMAATSYEIDVGCSQITIRWHGGAFRNIGAILDPRANISYAAWHLATLKDRFGSWQKATERYHSFQVDRGRAYACKVFQAMSERQSNTEALGGSCSS
ncbi:MAG: hypothetical protein DI537_05480 [Stutzerimonas stutzeri]|nr:MAG: hypothetical protein DI537_05480 [Stutzerimonas stutzeri]